MNGNNHPSPTRPMGSGNPQGPVAPRYGAPQAAPQAQGRGDELIAGNNTVFEFTGDAAGGADRGRKGTFMGSTLDLSHTDERRESNLKSGPSGWLFIGVAVLLAGGAIAWVMMGGSGNEAEASEDDSAVVAAAAEATPTPAEGEATPAEAGDSSGGAEAGSSGGAAAVPAEAAADDAKAAEEPKAEEPKAEEPKAEEPKAEEPKAEEPKAEPKKSTTKKKKKKSTTKKPSGGGGGGGSKGKTLKPKKPPRDPLSNLPKPPGG